MDAEVYEDAGAAAKAAAEYAVVVLSESTKVSGSATWVLAGGSTPMAAYRHIVAHHKKALDWSKVRLLIGDERCVPADSPESNWGQIISILKVLDIPESNLLAPADITSPKTAAVAYEKLIEPISAFDLVWLGMGEDGHTLSLFPGHESDLRSDRLVLPVHDSPKPPPERISLTIKALRRTRHCYILATGAGKADAVSSALAGDTYLPIARAATLISEKASVTWLLDEAAALPAA